ncbi:glycosyltransferase family 4 protein [Mixta tenebrionis]|uniref:Glycosyltransferase family 4 protein n=1 Tax=Mixta tenebrionis TaxID=2562439 RepID=A0A506VBU4_9GAMM|nr:glycosyltransferase family 4 protein [Mixta tenebrionis]TPW42700.1 glycosyltransferase family 4 protein [Mixta tenebrionis]
MKLLLIIDDYLPHSTRVGAKMFHELAIELHLQGHQVTVITPDFQQKDILNIDHIDGITIWRFKSAPIKDINKISRAINETLLSIRAWKAVRHLIKPDTFDGIIYYSPSIFWGGLVHRLKKVCHCPAYLVLRDLFPQWTIDAGMMKPGSLIEKYFRYFEHYSYRQATRIGLMSDKNLQLFRELHPDYHCEVLRNWADLQPVKKDDLNYISIREKLNLTNKIIYFYGGNIGHAQDMANLMRLAKKMQLFEHAHFLFIGQGDEVELINKLAEEWNLTNFSYLNSVSQKVFKNILSEVDVGLFSLSAQHTAHNFPGKLLGYMVESLPILGSVNKGNDLQDIINQHNAGFIYVNGEDDLLYEAAVKLYSDSELRNVTGRYAYQLLCEQFSVTSAAQLIVKLFEDNDDID